MEPCSILELSTTVIKLSAAVYGFFKDVHNAPRDVTEYLLVLEGSRKIFVDVQQYADLHEQSAFTKVHRNQLDTLTVVLEECQLSFGTQVSLIESYRSGCSELNFQKLRKRCEWVFGRDAIQSAGAKLQSSQTLLIQALNVSSGRDTVFIREAVDSVHLKVEGVQSALIDEEKQRQYALRLMFQYNNTLQSGISNLLEIARSNGLQAGTRLEDMARDVEREFESFELSERSHDKSQLRAVVADKSVNSAEETETLDATQTEAASNEGMNNATPRDEDSSSRSDSKDPVETINILRDKTLAKFIGDLDPYTQALLADGPANLQNILPAVPPPRFVDLVDRLQKVFDVFDRSSPSANLLSNTASLVLHTISQADLSSYKTMIAGLEKTVEVIEICQRETKLYKSDMIIKLTVSAYEDILKYHLVCIQASMQPGYVRAALAGTLSGRLQRISDRLQNTAAKILKEVEYQHRLEMRQASQRIAEMHIQQRHIIDMLNGQRRILESLQEEQQLMDVIKGQQRILQITQQIQQRLQMEERVS